MVDVNVSLPCDFYVRHPFCLWANRRMVNSVIELTERSADDAKLQLITEGVMDDIKTFLIANDMEANYADWTTIENTPLIIRRATTYGIVESLYSRHTKSFRSRVITSVGPVNVTVKGDDQTAMEHWATQYKIQLDRYIDSVNGETITVSTIDEDAIFSMEDIPPYPGTAESWHAWYNKNIAASTGST